MRALAVVFLLVAVALPAAAQDLPVEPYHNSVTLERDLAALVAAHPDIARFLGETSTMQQGKIQVVEVAFPLGSGDTDPRPTLLVDGAHHGNEVLAVESAYYFLESLLMEAEADRTLLADKRVLVVPVVNPDGFRKDTRLNGAAVDLNRNYPWNWGARGSDPNPGSLNYAGPSAASELETQTMMALMAAQPDLRAYVSFHTGSFDLVLPWSPTDDAPIPDWDLYARFLSEVENLTGLGHRDPAATGESIAHAYGNLGAFAILPEVSTEQFNPVTLSETRESIKEGMAIARLAFERLDDLRGRLVVESVGDGFVTVRNAGWGVAWNATADGATFIDVAPGATATLPVAGAGEVAWTPLAAVTAGDVGWLTEAGLPLVPERATLAVGGGAIAATPAAPLLAALAAVGFTTWAFHRRRA